MTGWLEGRDLPIQPDTEPDAMTVLGIKAWNMLGGQIDWQGLEPVAEILGINDIETLFAQLEVIRQHGQQ